MLDVWRASAKAMRLGVKIDGFSLAKWWFSPGFFGEIHGNALWGSMGIVYFLFIISYASFLVVFFTNLWGLGLYDII